jgi:hypothetical protein
MTQILQFKTFYYNSNTNINKQTDFNAKYLSTYYIFNIIYISKLIYYKQVII